MEFDLEDHERVQVHQSRRDVELEVQVDKAPVVWENEGAPALLKQQNVEMPVCRQIHLTRDFLDIFDLVHTSHCGSRCRSVRIHSICMSSMMSHVSALVASLFCLLSLASTFSLTSSCSLFRTSTFTMSRTPSIKPKAGPPNEEYCAVAMHNPLTSYEPKLLDNSDYSGTSAAIFDESVDIDTELTYSCDTELDDETIGKASSSPLFIQEREEPANLRQAYHSHEESLLPAQSFFAHISTGRPVFERSSCQKRKSSREMENQRIRILLERQKEQILAEVRTEIQKHEFQADSDRRSVQELNGIIESQRMEIDHTIASDEQLRRDQLLLQEQRSEQNRDLREAHIKSLHEMRRIEESSRVTNRWILERKIDRESGHS